MTGQLSRWSRHGWRGSTGHSPPSRSSNPLTLAFFASAVVGGGGDVSTHVDGLGFGVGAFVGSATGHFFRVAGGVMLRPVVVTRRGRILTSLLAAGLIAVMAVRLAVS